MRILAPLLGFFLLFGGVAPAAEPQIPSFWDMKERLPKPQLAELQRLRFLTTVDFPPFSYLDTSGRLTGFHVDLARRICGELGIIEICQIQAMPWSELDAALGNGQGEAILAGIAVTAESRKEYAFSRSYLQFPARFVIPKTSALAEPMHGQLAGKRIGVIAGSAHERMLRTYFAGARPITYSREDWLFEDLRTDKLDGAFGDGMRLAFWLSGLDSGACCRFAGGPYLAPEYLGAGLAIAVRPDNAVLAEAFNFALREIEAKGIFAELYLRYFPLSFY